MHALLLLGLFAAAACEDVGPTDVPGEHPSLLQPIEAGQAFTVYTQNRRVSAAAQLGEAAALRVVPGQPSPARERPQRLRRIRPSCAGASPGRA
jgi:hypothetical protein